MVLPLIRMCRSQNTRLLSRFWQEIGFKYDFEIGYGRRENTLFPSSKATATLLQSVVGSLCRTIVVYLVSIAWIIIFQLSYCYYCHSKLITEFHNNCNQSFQISVVKKYNEIFTLLSIITFIASFIKTMENFFPYLHTLMQIIKWTFSRLHNCIEVSQSPLVVASEYVDTEILIYCLNSKSMGFFFCKWLYHTLTRSTLLLIKTACII